MIEATDEMLEMAEQMLALRGFRVDRQTFGDVYRTLRTMELMRPQAEAPEQANTQQGQQATNAARDYSQGGAGGWKEPASESLKFGRQTAYRPEFTGEAQFAPDPRGRLFSDTVAARKAVDPEFCEALEADDEIARLFRRLDALQALVLVLAGRSEGYPPGDATLQRLIAELENAR